MRRGDEAVLALRRSSVDTPLWLSAVVLEELYAGASGRVRQSLERMEREFDRVKRISVPNLSDWTRSRTSAGALGGQIRLREDRAGTLANDALIAMSAARIGATSDYGERAGLPQTWRVPSIPVGSGHAVAFSTKTNRASPSCKIPLAHFGAILFCRFWTS